MRRIFTLRNAAKAVGVGAVATGASLWAVHRYINTPQPGAASQLSRERMLVPAQEIHLKDIPSRDEMIDRLKRSSVRAAAQTTAPEGAAAEDEIYDVLVIGGGSVATCALRSASRAGCEGGLHARTAAHRTVSDVAMLTCGVV